MKFYCLVVLTLTVLLVTCVGSQGSNSLEPMQTPQNAHNTELFLFANSRCVEDGHVYNVNVNSTSRGTLTLPNTLSNTSMICSDGSVPSLEIFSNVESPTLLYPLPHLHYLLGAYTVSEVDTSVHFTIGAMCDDGSVLCEANIEYTIHVPSSSSSTTMTSTVTTTVNPSSTETTSSPVKPTYPTCTTQHVQRTYKPGSTYTDDFPLDLIDTQCNYTVNIEQPSTGVAVVMQPKFPLRYIYRSPANAIDGSYSTLPYEVQCNEEVVCQGVIHLYLHEEIRKCVHHELVYEVLPAATLTGNFMLGEEEESSLSSSCVNSDITVTIQHSNHIGNLQLHNSTLFTFTAPLMEANALYSIRAYCNAVALCEADVAFLITKTIHSTTSTLTSTSLEPTVTSTSSSTAEPRPENVPCSVVRNFAVPTHHTIRGTLDIPLMPSCTFVTYSLSTANRSFEVLNGEVAEMSVIDNEHYTNDTNNNNNVNNNPLFGNLTMNIIGDFVYTSRGVEGVETVHVNVACMTTMYCLAEVHFLIYDDVTSTSPPFSSSTSSSLPPTTLNPSDSSSSSSSSSSSTTLPTLLCPDIYYYQTKPNVILHASINGVAGELTCPYAQYYLLNNYPREGLLEMSPNGAFTFAPRIEEGLVDFTFTMYCVHDEVCKGEIHIFVSNHWTSRQPTFYPSSSSSFSPTISSTSSSSSNEPSTQTTMTSTKEPALFVNTSQFTCYGTCTDKAWKAHPPSTSVFAVPLETSSETAEGQSTDVIWDNSPNMHFTRGDGKPVDLIEVTEENSSLVITAYTLIGNMAVRFPTFEPLPLVNKSYLDANEFTENNTSLSSLLGFELECLAEQSHSGLASDVWIWTGQAQHGSDHSNEFDQESNTARELSLYEHGTVGLHYNDGDSWYHKFGGKHVNCDTFVNMCRYAPLMTPHTVYDSSSNNNNNINNSTDNDSKVNGGTEHHLHLPVSLGQWSLSIHDCDATWKGTFPLSTLPLMQRQNKVSIWEDVAPHTYHSTLYSQAVQPQSWTLPREGVLTQMTGYDITIRTEQFVSSNKNERGVPLYSIDTEFFESTEVSTGDVGFGLNILVYPLVTPDMVSSYAVDRHVIGFKWIEQRWQSPNQRLCPTCVGTRVVCSNPYEIHTASFTGPFPDGDCPNATALVYLSKGPSLPANRCPAHPIHVINQPGFSPPQNCRTSFQNLTLRGVLVGSRKLNMSDKQHISYEGLIQLQLLMADGTRELVDFHLSLYISHLALHMLPSSTATLPESLLEQSLSSETLALNAERNGVREASEQASLHSKYEAHNCTQANNANKDLEPNVANHIAPSHMLKSTSIARSDIRTNRLHLHLCRSGSYWPVLDPLGTSVPIEPFVLSVTNKNSLCVDSLSTSFGPNDWVMLALSRTLPLNNPTENNNIVISDYSNSDNNNSSSSSSSSSSNGDVVNSYESNNSNTNGNIINTIVVESVYVVYGGKTRVYLLYRDATTNALVIPPQKENVFWWQHTHPFLNFREVESTHVKSEINNMVSDSTEETVVVAAYAFIPGAINIGTRAEIVVEVSYLFNDNSNNNNKNNSMSEGESSDAADNNVHVSLRQRDVLRKVINIDPQLTQRSRLGPNPAPSTNNRNEHTGDLYAIGAVAGVTVAIIVVAVFYMVADNKRPLPKWIPRGKLIKQTVLSILPANLRKTQSKEKTVVHRDMYAAMTSGHY